MSYRANSHTEVEILKRFEDLMEESDDVSDEVAAVIAESLRRTTLSSNSPREILAEELIEVALDETE